MDGYLPTLQELKAMQDIDVRSVDPDSSQGGHGGNTPAA